MGQFFSGILALLCACGTWTLAFTLSREGDAGSRGPLHLLVFFSPIVLFMLPLALQELESGDAASALWSAAFAPIAGLFNFVLVAGIGAYFMSDAGKDAAQSRGMWAASLAWLLPFLLLRVWRRWRRAGKPGTGAALPEP